MTPDDRDRGLDSLILDLLEWLANEPRTYAQTMDAWRTSCPRLAVWEEALDRGLVTRAQGGGVHVKVTADGRRYLRNEGRSVLQVMQPVACRADCASPNK